MNARYNYDQKSDSLFILVREGEQDSFEEIVPGINIELDANGEILGVEVLRVSRFSESIEKPAAVKR